ncbi:hypothetical protein, partial [Acetobacter thailandicus]|uniref:hypothetical protein n=1 Tax=Acetobacter thailandicus TaxID=1502842 RepID=UPI001BAB832F
SYLHVRNPYRCKLHLLSQRMSPEPSDGQTEYVSGSTVVSGAVALANGVTLTVGSGAVVSGLSTSASTVIVESGGTLKDTSLVNGVLSANAGATSDENSLNSVTAYFSSGSVSENDSFYTTSGNSVKYVYVYSGGHFILRLFPLAVLSILVPVGSYPVAHYRRVVF